MNLLKLYVYFCFITYPAAMTLLTLSKFEEKYSMELLISGIVLTILDSIGITLYCCSNSRENLQKQ